jgi:hypothetical protein
MREQRTARDTRPGAGTIAAATSDQLREGYLQRLRRLLRLRRDHFEELNDAGLRLLDRSIFAAYCDCIDIGQGDAARSILKDVRLTVSMTRTPR